MKGMVQYLRPGPRRILPLGEPPSQSMVEAARTASKKDLVSLRREGGDVNGSWQHYRPLQAVMQPAPQQPAKADSKRVNCLKWLLEQGADPEALGGWPSARAILVAAFSGEPAYVEALRAAGARVDGFFFAAVGDLKRVERLLRDDPAFASARDTSGMTALHCCAASRMTGDLTGIANLLLDHGADVNAKAGTWGQQLDAVVFAVGTCHSDLFTLLLERGADPSAALASALWRTCTEFAEIALRHGASVDIAKDDGKPVLNQMVRWDRVKHALWLLEKGASPNLADDRGWTALHQAAARGNEGLVKALLDAGGDTALKSKDGKMPSDIARASGKAAAAELLGAAH